MTSAPGPTSCSFDLFPLPAQSWSFFYVFLSLYFSFSNFFAWMAHDFCQIGRSSFGSWESHNVGTQISRVLSYSILSKKIKLSNFLFRSEQNNENNEKNIFSKRNYLENNVILIFTSNDTISMKIQYTIIFQACIQFKKEKYSIHKFFKRVFTFLKKKKSISVIKNFNLELGGTFPIKEPMGGSAISWCHSLWASGEFHSSLRPSAAFGQWICFFPGGWFFLA